jgi:hypothetical protein
MRGSNFADKMSNSAILITDKNKTTWNLRKWFPELESTKKPLPILRKLKN